MPDIIMLILLGVMLFMVVDHWIKKYKKLKRIVEEKDDFEKLMYKQLELDAIRFRAHEDLLREACRFWVEDAGEDVK